MELSKRRKPSTHTCYEDNRQKFLINSVAFVSHEKNTRWRYEDAPGRRGTQGKLGERDTQPLTNEEMLHVPE